MNALAVAAASAMLWSATVDIAAQGRGGRGGGPPAPPGRAAAPVDLTGTWVSVVTEDWQWRMRTPAKGDTTSVPSGCLTYSAAIALRRDSESAMWCTRRCDSSDLIA